MLKVTVIGGGQKSLLFKDQGKEIARIAHGHISEGGFETPIIVVTDSTATLGRVEDGREIPHLVVSADTLEKAREVAEMLNQKVKIARGTIGNMKTVSTIAVSYMAENYLPPITRRS